MRNRVAIGGTIGAAVGALAILVAVKAAGIGLGTYIPAAVLFPASMLVAVSVESINLLSAALALVQYPLYGATAVGERNNLRRWLAVAGLHLLLAVFALLSVQRSEVFA